MSDAVIYDRGYRAYEGELTGRRGARRAIVRDGVRRVLGLRRKARRKILPWGLLALGLVMASVFIGLQFVAGSISAALEEGLPSYPELFDVYSRISLLFLAVTMPELLGPDRRQGVLSVYFSRPLTVADYLGAKGVAYVLIASMIYLVPQLAFHLGQAALSSDGFIAYLTGNLDVLWFILASTLAFVGIHGGVLAVISAHVDRTPFAAATFLGVLIAGNNLTEVISQAPFTGARWFSLLAFDAHARYVRDWVFDADLATYPMEAAGFDPWVSVVVIAAVVAGGAVWTYRRYRRLA
jgi:ABC-2 type transport system permease protein